MIAIIPVLLSVWLLGAALLLRGEHTAVKARGAAVRAAICAVVVAFLALIVTSDRGPLTVLASLPVNWLPAGLLRIAPLVTALVAVLATGLSPAVRHSGRTQARILYLFAIAEAFLGIERGPVLLLLWGLSALLTWRALSRWNNNPGEARVFGIYQVASLACFAGGVLLLELAKASPAQENYFRYGSLLVLIAIGLREASFPFQSWFPRFVQHSPMGLVVAYAGPQLGIYAFVELLAGQPLPLQGHELGYFGAATALLGALFGIVQANARRAVAYLIMSQTGLIALGLSTETGLIGAILNWQVLAVATSGFAMLLAGLEARRGIVPLGTPRGSYATTPRLATAFLVFGLASVGFPLTLGFVAEDLLVQGTVNTFPGLALVLIVATAINGACVMRMFFHLFTGTRDRGGVRDLTLRERRLVGVILGLVILFGIIPSAILNLELGRSTAPIGTSHTSEEVPSNH